MGREGVWVQDREEESPVGWSSGCPQQWPSRWYPYCLPSLPQPIMVLPGISSHELLVPSLRVCFWGNSHEQCRSWDLTQDVRF